MTLTNVDSVRDGLLLMLRLLRDVFRYFECHIAHLGGTRPCFFKDWRVHDDGTPAPDVTVAHIARLQRLRFPRTRLFGKLKHGS